MVEVGRPRLNELNTADTRTPFFQDVIQRALIARYLQPKGRMWPFRLGTTITHLRQSHQTGAGRIWYHARLPSEIFARYRD